jgi:hypothetical protein
MVHFSEFVQQSQTESDDACGSLVKCGVCLAGACLTRYDGWFLAGVMGVASAAVWSAQRSKLWRGFAKFILLASAGPILWLLYNRVVYGDALEFSRGPYSAKAIEAKIAFSPTHPYPGWHSPQVAFSYFFKAAEQTVAEGRWQKLWIALLLAGIVAIFASSRKRWPLLLLLTPIPFYILSVGYGSVPICLPEWWPFSYYNVRFGLELLPAIAVFSCVALHWGLSTGKNMSVKRAAAIAFVLVIAGSYTVVWRAKPICFREGWANSRSRFALETELARTLQLLPHNSTILMYLGDHVGALQDAGIALRRTINEGNHRPWRRPDDPQGLWERALADPKDYADYAVAIGDDPVAKYASKQGLTSAVVIRAYGQPPATIYWTHRPER